jgi:hypothetical protein
MRFPKLQGFRANQPETLQSQDHDNAQKPCKASSMMVFQGRLINIQARAIGTILAAQRSEVLDSSVLPEKGVCGARDGGPNHLA